MQPTVILIRHERTALNAEARVRAWLDIEIGETAAARTTAAILTQFNLANPLHSSDLRRAQQTAEIIAEPNLLEISPEFELRPWDVGEFSGRKLDEISSALKYYLENPNLEIPGGESFQSFLTRWKRAFMRFVAQANRAPEDGAIVVVTHSRNIEAARYFVTGDRSTLLTANSVSPGSATAWQTRGGKLIEIPLADVKADVENPKEIDHGQAAADDN